MTGMTGRSVPRILLVSDASGQAVERLAAAALQHFAGVEPRLKGFARVRSTAEVHAVASRARSERAFVAYTLSTPELRTAMHDAVEAAGVPSVDVVGGMVSRLATFLGLPPRGAGPDGRTPQEEQYRRTEATEFVIANDDGQEPGNLVHADLVLVGVSRTGKTPVALYLACRGWKVANLALVPDVPLPEELSRVEPHRVFGLIMETTALARVRQERLKYLAMPLESAYGLAENVALELRWTRELFAAHPQWRLVDVTGKAVEEVASEILAGLRQRVTAHLQA